MLKNHMSTCKKTHVNMQHLFLMLLPEYSATRMLRAHVAFDCATAWTRLGVCVARGWRPRGRRQGWLACAAGGGGNFD